MPTYGTPIARHSAESKLTRFPRAMSRDETLFPDPDTFNPDRYLDSYERQDPRKFVFGFGRRFVRFQLQ